MYLFIFIFATLLSSVLVGLLTIPRIVVISKKKRLFDEISNRKVHMGNVPRLGGMAFFPAFLFSMCLMMGMRYYLGFIIESVPLEKNVFRELMFLWAGSTMLFFIGLADDLTGVSYKAKFTVQIFGAILLIFTGVKIENLGGLFGLIHIPVFLGWILTVLVIVLIINAYNLIDGIDGLCSGLSLLTLTTLGGWFIFHHLYVYAMMTMAICGVVAVFFLYNIKGKEMKVFMGDTGSLALGYLIAFFGLKFYHLNIGSNIFDVHSTPAILLGMVFIPVFDTIRVFLARITHGLSPFYPDKRHIHHKMLRTGLSHTQSTICILFIQAFFILLNVLLSRININLLFAINIALGILLIMIVNKLNKTKKQPSLCVKA